MTIDYDELERLLRKDSGNYGRMKSGGIPSEELVSWDAREQRAWAAADTIRHLRLILGHIDPRDVAEAEQQIFYGYGGTPDGRKN